MSRMTYEEMGKFAETCEHMCNLTCKKRNKLRNCYRPLCCGFCPTNDECEGICTPIRERMEKDGNSSSTVQDN